MAFRWQAAPTVAAEVAEVSAVAAAPIKEEVVVAGTGVDDAMAIKGEWQELPQGESHWYSFRYDGGEGQIKVNLDADSTKDIRFSLRTPEMSTLAEDRRNQSLWLRLQERCRKRRPLLDW